MITCDRLFLAGQLIPGGSDLPQLRAAGPAAALGVGEGRSEPSRAEGARHGLGRICLAKGGSLGMLVCQPSGSKDNFWRNM